MAAEGNHAYGGLGSFGTLVAYLASGYAVESLLLRLHGEDSEYDRDVAVGVECGYALCDALTYVVKVRCVATYHASYGYDSVKEA